MKNSRRNFLKIAGISALGLGAKPVFNAFASSEGTSSEGTSSEGQEKTRQGESAVTGKRWGMVVDTRKVHSSHDLEPMIEACHSIHNVPEIPNRNHEIKWIWEEEFEHVFPGKENEYLDERNAALPFIVLCNHCENPPCVRVCPTKATFKRDDGIVMMDFHRCIGCRFCMAGCPYGSRSFNFRNPRDFLTSDSTNPLFPTRMKGVVEKCNFCAERLAVGKMPACVEASHGILAFGDLNDPDSNVRNLLKSNYTIRRKQGMGTGPSVYYIV